MKDQTEGRGKGADIKIGREAGGKEERWRSRRKGICGGADGKQ